MNGMRFPLHTCGVLLTVRVPWSQKGFVNTLPVGPDSFSTFFRSSCYVLLWAGILFFMTLKMNPSLKNIALLVRPLWLLRKLRSFYSRINLKKKERWLFGKTSNNLIMNLMFIGPCIIVIVEEWKTNLMSLVFYFTSYVLNVFRTLIYPSSGACDCVDELPLRSSCVLQPAKRTPPKISNTQRTENKTTDVVIHQRSRKLLMMDILMSETCWAHKKWNKIAIDIQLVFHSSTNYLFIWHR